MEKKKTKTRETVEALIVAIIIALFVRSFIVQAFKIPSTSMVPTLLVGDHLLVNRLSYVIKVPIVDTVIVNLGTPKRGDVVVFRYPMDRDKDFMERKDFIKRVIGLPGDILEIKNKRIYLNGRAMEDPHGNYSDPRILPGFLSPRDNLPPLTLPKDCFFVMGDNRDNSLDSRFWGFVTREDLIGKALVIYFSWNGQSEDILSYIRWTRMGRIIR
jgi:signal peptidase I